METDRINQQRFVDRVGSPSPSLAPGRVPASYTPEAILENMGDGFWALDRRWTITYFNRAAETFFGHARDSVLGRCLWDVYPSINGSVFEQQYRRAMAERVTVEFVEPSGARPGCWLEVRAFPVEDGLCVVFRDVTQRHLAEAALVKQEADLSAIFRQTSAGIVEADLAGRFSRVNDGFCELLGRSRDELLGGLGIRDVTHPEDIESSFRNMRQVAGTSTPCQFEKRFVRSDGAVVWVNNSLDCIRDTAGEARSLLAVIVDITERKATEARLRESEARFRHMADSAPALIWMTDATGRVTFINMHFEYVFGRPASEVLGSAWQALILEEDLRRYRADWAKAIRNHGTTKAEVRARDRNGDVRWFRSESVPRLDDRGKFLGYTGCAVDITEAKVAESHLKLLIDELNHRVKNTLATVQSIATMTLRKAAGTENVRADFEGRLLALSSAHDVLTRENWEGANLRAIVDQALAPHAQRQEGRIRTRGRSVRLKPRIALALAMALQELVTNAIKYGALSTAEGKVSLSWTISRGRQVRLRLRWKETGGPPVSPPDRRGFGSRLIERSLAADLNGTAVMAFEPAGLICTIEAPLEEPA